MELFLRTSFAFPVVVFSFLLCISVLYWITVALGVLEVDSLDFEVDAGTETSYAEGIGGLLLKLGLKDVPVTLWLTLLVFFSWLFCYFAELLMLRFLPLGLLRYPLGVGVVVISLLMAVPCTRVLTLPLRPLFCKAKGVSSKSLLGQVVVVRSARVTSTQGEATMDDGGAGLILRVRADEANSYQRGDRLVLLEYTEADHAYRVITENDFNGIE
tara:strand:+ start:51988 stop:52629 length:642 start_codon:yes stop_codon:yes gene_type:complete